MEIVVYGTPSDPNTRLCLDWIKKHDLAFREIDVSRDRGAAHEMHERTRQMNTPVVHIGEEWIIGYDPDSMERAMRITSEGKSEFL